MVTKLGIYIGEGNAYVIHEERKKISHQETDSSSGTLVPVTHTHAAKLGKGNTWRHSNSNLLARKLMTTVSLKKTARSGSFWLGKYHANEKNLVALSDRDTPLLSIYLVQCATLFPF